MQDIVKLGHLDSAAHKVWAFVNQLILSRVIFIIVRVVNRLNISFYFSFDYSTHLV